MAEVFDMEIGEILLADRLRAKDRLAWAEEDGRRVVAARQRRGNVIRRGQAALIGHR